MLSIPDDCKPLAEAVEQLVATAERAIHRARVGHAVGHLYATRKTDIDDALIVALEIPAKAQAVSFGLDRVSLPMEEPRRRPVGRPRKDAPKRPVQRVYRMAYCATVTFHDESGAALYTIRQGLRARAGVRRRGWGGGHPGQCRDRVGDRPARCTSTWRMADFAIVATTAEPALGLAPGAFLQAYAENRQEAVEVGLDGNPIVSPRRSPSSLVTTASL